VNVLGEVIGELCKTILPIPEESYSGNPDSFIAVCTLSSIDLLKKFVNSKVLEHISIAGRLFSENKGIDSIVNYVNNNKKISTILVCGKEVWGHKAGHSLFQLHENGIDTNNRIINSSSPDPFLSVSKSNIQYFRNNITLVNLINETNFETISNKIKIL
jgi:tetrahydromethanopterin S-methyltransferase subunit A